MSVYIDFDGEQVDQLATNQGWADFRHWAQFCGGEVGHLGAYGWSQNMSALADQLEKALGGIPPEETVKTTVDGLIEMLRENEGAEACSVNDGMEGD